MKKIWFVPLIAVFAFFNSCQKDSQETSDDLLAQQIASADNKTSIPPADLPQEAKTYVDENHFETYVETAFLVPQRGYEMILGDETPLHCDLRGRILRPHRDHFSHGPCGRGEPVGVDALPGSIMNFVAVNYPEATVKRAKQMTSGTYYIKIDNPELILIFNESGEFVEATVLFYHCRPLGEPIDVATLPESITTYLAENFPDAEILVAFQKNNGMYIVGVSTPDGRKIIAFDSDGTFLFVRP